MTVTTEEFPGGTVSTAYGDFATERDGTMRSTKMFPYWTFTGRNVAGDTVTFTPELLDSDDPTDYAETADGRWQPGKFNVFRGIEMAASPNSAYDPNPVTYFSVGYEDQAAMVGHIQYDYSLGLSGWTAGLFPRSIDHSGGWNRGTQAIYETTPSSGLFQGNLRVYTTCSNAQTIGQFRGSENAGQLTNVSKYIIQELSFPLCSAEDLEEARNVFDSSSHVRLGGVAFWLEPVASTLSNGGSLLAAQVGFTTYVPQLPQAAFSALSTLPNMKHVGKFKKGAYGWYNPDRVRDLEFTNPRDFQNPVFWQDKSKIVIVVSPENTAATTAPYLMKVNGFYNYRWQSRVFMPLPTPCSFELLQRFLITGAGYCNMGENPDHVAKLKQIAKDFANNPKNRELARDALSLKVPGLKGFAKGLGETFVPGWDILSNVVSPYL